MRRQRVSRGTVPSVSPRASSGPAPPASRPPSDRRRHSAFATGGGTRAGTLARIRARIAPRRPATARGAAPPMSASTLGRAAPPVPALAPRGAPVPDLCRKPRADAAPTRALPALAPASAVSATSRASTPAGLRASGRPAELSTAIPQRWSSTAMRRANPRSGVTSATTLPEASIEPRRIVATVSASSRSLAASTIAICLALRLFPGRIAQRRCSTPQSCPRAASPRTRSGFAPRAPALRLPAVPHRGAARRAYRGAASARIADARRRRVRARSGRSTSMPRHRCSGRGREARPRRSAAARLPQAAPRWPAPIRSNPPRSPDAASRA